MTSDQSFDPIADVIQRIEFAKTLYLADLRSMPHEMLAKQCGGKARTGYDVTFELTGMYSVFADLLKARSGSITGPQGWVTAPPEFCNPEGARDAIAGALDRFVAALQTYEGDVLQDQYPSPVGPFSPLGMANLAVWHTMYHSGQLNFIQTLCGDDQFHWLG
jgi:hypothetical protein